MRIIALPNAIGRKRTAAFAMPARIGQQHGIPVLQEQHSVAKHAFAIVSDPVQKNYRITVGYSRRDVPGLQDRSISSLNADILQRCPKLLPEFCSKLSLVAQGTMVQVKASLRQHNAGNQRQK